MPNLHLYMHAVGFSHHHVFFLPYLASICSCDSQRKPSALSILEADGLATMEAEGEMKGELAARENEKLV